MWVKNRTIKSRTISSGGKTCGSRKEVVDNPLGEAVCPNDNGLLKSGWISNPCVSIPDEGV